jgi:hypothetical protein
MNKEPSMNSSRTHVWKNAVFWALIAATLMLVIVKLLTGIVFMTALLFAVAIFMIAFGFLMRMAPRRN